MDAQSVHTAGGGAAPAADNGPQAGTRQDALEADGAGKAAYEGMAQPEGVDGNVDPDRENRYNTFQQSVYAQIDGMRPLKINWNAQNRHVEGTKEYIPGRSILHADPNKLIELYAGKGEPVKSKKGEWTHKERFIHHSKIGIYRSFDENKVVLTPNGIIHYSKDKGIHVVPSKPGEE